MKTHSRTQPLAAVSRLALGAVLLAGIGCSKLEVPDFNAQSLSELGQNASAAAVSTASVGLLDLSRRMNTSFLNSHVAIAGSIGREGMELDPSNPQDAIHTYVTVSNQEPSTVGWGPAYQLIKQGNVLLAALSSAQGLTDPEREAIRGYTKTLQALSFIRLSNAFADAGLPIDVDRETTDVPAPVVSNNEVKAHIVQLLDEAKVHLLAGGSRFPFPMPPGFAGFTIPSTFLTFNRALMARIEVYRGSEANLASPGSGTANYTAALAALTESFLNVAAPMQLGVFDNYSGSSGDLSNPLYDPTCRQLFGMPENRTQAQLTPGGQPDLRYSQKHREITPKVIAGITVDNCWTIYPSQAAPVAIIRNEELILNRAEARWQTGDRAGALQDINLVRTVSGGLAPLAADPGDPGLLDELLYNRRYSLNWEGAHRWVDMRRFGRLAQLPKELPIHHIFPYLQLPLDECTPRSPQPAGCTPPPGI